MTRSLPGLLLIISTALAVPSRDVGATSAPPRFLVRSQRLQTPEGGDVTIPCDVSDKFAQPLIIKKEEESSEDRLLFVGEVRLAEPRFAKRAGQMTISDVQRADAGAYLCYYQDVPQLKLRHFVEVQYPATIIPITPLKQKVNKGASVTLECSAEGNPRPKVQWSREGGALPSGSKEEEGDSLTLEGVDRHVEGRYTCSADNGVGEAASVSMEVLVEYPPEIFVEQEIVRTGAAARVELVCVVHARPSAAVAWSRDGGPVAHEGRAEAHRGAHRHLLTIAAVTPKDLGVYRCQATNSRGTAYRDISVTDEPTAPLFTSAPNSAEETSYILTWEAESYYPLTEYHIMYHKLPQGSGDWFDVTRAVAGAQPEGATHHLSHALSGLSPAADYEATVKVRNKFRWGRAASYNFSTRKEALSLQATAASGAPSTPSSLPFAAVAAVTCVVLLCR